MGNSLEVCSSKLTLGDFNNLTKSLQCFDTGMVTLFGKLNCTGFSINPGRRGVIYSFASSSLNGSVKSVAVEDDRPRKGCVWLYDNYCLSGAMVEVCDSIEDLTTIGFGKRLSSIKMDLGVTLVELFTQPGFTGTATSLVKTKYSFSGMAVDKMFMSLRITKN